MTTPQQSTDPENEPDFNQSGGLGQNPPDIRIGDAERNAAVEALGEHLGSGRLDLDEYGDRAAKVTNARTASDIEAVFGDLPEPRPVGAAVSKPQYASLAATSAGVPATQPGPNKALIGLIAAMPIIALGLFFLTDLWYFFLLVPLAGALLGPYINRDKN